MNTALSDGPAVLFRECVRRALHTWETANCSPFNQYCQANANSTGVPAVVIATGSSYIAQNDLVLQGTQMPTSSFASVIFGDARAFVSLPGGSAGNLCVGGNIGRLFDSIGTTNAGGTITFDVDNGALSFSSTGPFTLMAGDQLMFQ